MARCAHRSRSGRRTVRWVVEEAVRVSPDGFAALHADRRPDTLGIGRWRSSSCSIGSQRAAVPHRAVKPSVARSTIGALTVRLTREPRVGLDRCDG